MAHHHEHEHCETCSHEHHHEHEHSLKKQLWLIVVTATLLVGATLIEHNTSLATWQLLLVYLVPYLLKGNQAENRNAATPEDCQDGKTV